MSTRTMWFAIAFLVALTAAQPKGHQQLRSCISWSNNPEEIGIEELQKILQKMSASKSMLYSPIGLIYEDYLLDLDNIPELNKRIMQTVELSVEPLSLRKENLRLRPKKRNTIRKPAKLKQNVQTRLMCECPDRVHDTFNPKSMKCVCQEIPDQVLAAYTRFHYLKINPESQKKPGFKRNKAFGKIID